MIDVTDRPPRLRRAVAEARVHARPETLAAVREGRVPKGDVAATTRAAALLGLKRTPDLLPFCHRIPVEHAAVEVTVGEDAVHVTVEVAAVARTGMEVEAMTGAAIAALNVYDMLKPLDSTTAIGEVRVVTKSGGRSDHRPDRDTAPSVGVLVVSDSVAAREAEDSAGAATRTALEEAGLAIGAFDVVPDEADLIADVVRGWVDELGLELVVAVGGTGAGHRDRTPEAMRTLLDLELPGLGEAIRAHGRERTPHADLSRAVGGVRGGAVLLAVPGSTRGAVEAMEAVLPWVVHLLDVLRPDFRHDE
jgi:molybdenum cofactor biosynthesis protein MoaC